MITIFNYKILPPANDGLQMRISSEKSKAQLISQAPGDFNTAFKPPQYLGFSWTDLCEERPESLAAQSPACLWNLLFVPHPCLPQGDNLNSSWAVPRCLWNLHCRDALDSVLQEETTTHPDFVWLQAELGFCLWPDPSLGLLSTSLAEISEAGFWVIYNFLSYI